MTEPTCIRVGICDGDALARAILSGYVATWSDCTLVSTGCDDDYADRAIQGGELDVLLVDARTTTVKAPAPGQDHRAKILYLMSQEDAELAQCMATGTADGLVAKDLAPDVLRLAVRRLHQGLCVASAGQLGVLPIIPRSPAVDVDARESQVLRMVGQGWSNGHIAMRLHLSVSSVKAVVSELMRRFGVRNRVSLVLRAAEAGLIPGTVNDL